MKLTIDDKKQIAEAIKKVELKTAGEIVPVILSKSDFYPAAHFRWSLMMGIIFSIICYYCYDFNDPIALIWSQLPGMIFGYLIAFIPLFKRIMTSEAEMKAEVHQKALELFHHNKVSMTKDRTGIMIFISLLEHKIEILADGGISAKLEKTYWNGLVTEIISYISKGRTVDGLVWATHECETVLKAHFPITRNDRNEVCNELITDLKE